MQRIDLRERERERETVEKLSPAVDGGRRRSGWRRRQSGCEQRMAARESSREREREWRNGCLFARRS